MKKILTCFLIICLFVFTQTLFVNAANTDVYNVVTCPGEDMSSEMRINWHSPTSITGLKVEYTIASDATYANSTKVNGVNRSFSREDTKTAKYVGFSTPRYVWTAELTDLNASTKYIYRIISDSKVYTGDYTFETAAATEEEFSFLFMTDPQYYTESTASKFNIMTEHHLENSNIKFAFITGDISDKGGNSSYWDMFYTKSSIAKIPFATTVGNHEYYDSSTNTVDNTIYQHFFNNPQNGPEHVKGSSYYFLYNNALFIMLDSEDKGNLEEQKTWFKSVCNSYSPSYIIVGNHRSCYAGAEYYQDGVTYLKQWGSVFDECNVDLVLSGHDHMYARTKSLYKDEISTDEYLGTTYILGGSAGTKYYSKKNDTNLPKWDCYFDRTTVSTVITLGKNYLTTKTYDIDTNLKDSSKITRKRFGTVDENFTKQAFEESIQIKNNAPDYTSGTVSWSEKGYGNVISLSFKLLNSGDNLGQKMFLNNNSVSYAISKKLYLGEINNIEVTVSYKDGSKNVVKLELDNRIEWGKINKLSVTDITSSTITLLIDQTINSEYDYIQRYQIRKEDDKVAKNYSLKGVEKETGIVTIVLDKGLDPNTTYEYELRALNVNGTAVWTQKFTFTTAKFVEPEDQYQFDMFDLAIAALISNITKSK